MFKNKSKLRSPQESTLAPRTLVLGVLGAITLGVAVLSVAVSYGILVPAFGAWAVPTVAALDALWVVVQAAEVLAGSNTSRVRRVQAAGLTLTAVIAAIPTIDLAMTLTRAHQPFDLAVVLTPVAIVATKGAWWIVLPALGRRTSDTTRRNIATRRQEVADQLEVMEADAAHRIELLRVATDLQERVTTAETEFRRATLDAQQRMTAVLHAQAEITAAAVADMPLPALVAQVELPELDGWVPASPALGVTPVTAAVTPVTQVSALTGPQPVTSRVTLEELALVSGVPTPLPGAVLTDAQLEVVIRFQRHRTDPPSSYRQASTALRAAGFRASEERVRHTWRELMVKEGAGDAEEMDDAQEEAEASA
ncbi:hypothetical protein OG311_38105 (plasmid) [Streptomyces sp. NBC_01343]|uniref:hypothetical protein n=1 Tax=Streptomyces sp. NBC_01343 TaxID=2903832 RepID=UPI002E0E3425|nr:hypothetical protein OG311_38105 [Streptomyces sp. NBC_01343]